MLPGVMRVYDWCVKFLLNRALALEGIDSFKAMAMSSAFVELA